MKNLHAVLTCVSVPTFIDDKFMDTDYTVGREYIAIFRANCGDECEIIVQATDRPLKHAMSLAWASEHFIITINNFQGN